MAAELAQAIAQGGRVKIPDTFLVARALGQGMRRFSPEAVYALADRLRVKTVVWGYVGHDKKNHMQLSLRTEQRDPAAAAFRAAESAQRDWKAVEFSDTAPPLEAFHRMLPEVLSASGYAGRQPPAQPAPDVAWATAMDLPESPEKMLQEAPPGSLHAAARLIFLGALAPEASEYAAQRLFGKALLRLDAAPLDAPEYRWLRAYALYRLHQGPAALAALGTDGGPEAQALQALLKGNLTELEAVLDKIGTPLPRVIFALEANDLKQRFGLRAPESFPFAAVLPGKELANAWKVLLQRRFMDIEQWGVQNNAPIKHLLDQAFPVADLTLENIVRGLQTLAQNPFESPDIDLSVARHLRKLLTAHADSWCCMDTTAASNAWNWLDLLGSLGEANLVKKIARIGNVQGLPETALALMNNYDEIYAGHPRFAALKSKLLLYQAKTLRPDAAVQPSKLAHDQALLAAYWGQGDDAAYDALATNQYSRLPEFQPFPQAYSRDIPLASGWWWFFYTFEPPDKEKLLATLDRLLTYIPYDFAIMEGWLGGDEHDRAARQNATETLLETRFHGHPKATVALAGWRIRQGRFGEAKQLYREAIARQPDAWENYAALGRLLVEQDGDYAGADQVFESFPGFGDTTRTDQVALSNDAFDAGKLLYWHGFVEGAKRLYKISAGYDTGSSAGMVSQIRLDLLAGDYTAAARAALADARRYEKNTAFRDYLALLHLLGYSAEAWAAFNQVADKFDNYQVWFSALVGHRVQGLDDEGLRSWTTHPHIRRSVNNGRFFSPWFVLLWYLEDRPPSADFPKLMAELENARVKFAAGPAVPSRFRLAERKKAPAKPADGPAPSLSLFAEGYVALRQRDFPAAVERFDRLAAHYRIEGEPGSDEHSPLTFLLPYFAFASAKAGDTLGLEAFIDAQKYPLEAEGYFDYQLAKAMFAGLRGDTAGAAGHLRQAFNRRPTLNREILSAYQYAEACEWLYRETQQEEFRRLALDWARQYQQIQPMYAWAYAMEAALADAGESRTRALAIALYLDRRSERIQALPADERAKAEQWLKIHTPFKPSANTASQPEGV